MQDAAAHLTTPVIRKERTDWLHTQIEVRPTGLKHKALADGVVNFMLGCPFGCPHCFVPDVAAGKQIHLLKRYGVTDAHSQWGQYALLRQFDEGHFVQSAQKLEQFARQHPVLGGNHAVLYSITSDAWAPIPHEDKARQRELNAYRQHAVARSIELVRDHTDLKIRALTRSSLIQRDFPLFQSLGSRGMIGTSLMTLDDSIQRAYEPAASSPEARIRMLERAHEMGIPVFVALAPIPPETGEDDMRELFERIAPLQPQTVFCEPIHVRGRNVDLIESSARRLGVTLDTGVFATRDSARAYALRVHRMAEKIAPEFGLENQLHLWIDEDLLGRESFVVNQPDPAAYRTWRDKWWNRVSEWPTAASITGAVVQQTA